MKKKCIIFLLAIAICVTTYTPIYAMALDGKNNNKLFTDLFYAAAVDEIILYYKGHPVQKKDIDLKTGEISKNKIKEITLKNNNSQLNVTTSSNTTIPSPYNEAVVEKVLFAPRFGQRTTTFYLTNKSGKEVAQSLDFNFKENFILLLAGFIPYFGPVIAVGGFFSTARDLNLARKIRDQTDDDYDVQWSAIDNQYGTFYAADYWNGRTIDLSVIDSDISTEEITSISYRRK